MGGGGDDSIEHKLFFQDGIANRRECFTVSPLPGVYVFVDHPKKRKRTSTFLAVFSTICKKAFGTMGGRGRDNYDSIKVMNTIFGRECRVTPSTVEKLPGVGWTLTGRLTKLQQFHYWQQPNYQHRRTLVVWLKLNQYTSTTLKTFVNILLQQFHHRLHPRMCW